MKAFVGYIYRALLHFFFFFLQKIAGIFQNVFWLLLLCVFLYLHDVISYRLLYGD